MIILERLNDLLNFKRTGFDECLVKNDHLSIESILENFQKEGRSFEHIEIAEVEKKPLLQEYERQLETVQKRYQQILLLNNNPLYSDLKLKEKHTINQRNGSSGCPPELDILSTEITGQTVKLSDGKRVSRCVDCSIIVDPQVCLQKPINIFDCRNCKIQIDCVQQYIGSVYLNKIKNSEIHLSWDPSLKNQIRMSNLENCQIRISKGELSESTEDFVVILEGCENLVFDIQSQSTVTIKDFDNIMGNKKSFSFSELPS